ncbi:MAG: hypothetical protein MR443_08840 [Lachnospiraceae bacterium]|nr:hypothetical protein [Lachnospiraceae bacterium]
MKKNYIAITLGLMLGATAVAGCGTAKTTDTSATEEAQTVYGEITEISEDSITIKVGTQKEAQETKEASVSDNSDDADSTDESAEANSSDSTDGKTDTSDSDSEDSADASANTDSRDAAGSSDSGKQSDNANGTPGEAPSMLDDTGEELTVKITDDTEITKDTSHGGMGQSTPPEMPSGEAPGSNSDSNGAPDGQSTPPEKPDGESADGSSDSNGAPNGQSTPPEKPDGDSTDGSSDSNGAPDGQSTPPEKPDGESTDGNSDSNGAPDGQSTPPEKPDGDSTDSNSTSDSDDSESEDIDFDDLAVGDIVEVSYDEDGDVVTVTVLMSENGMGMGQPGGASAGVTSYDALNEYSEDTTVDGETIASTGTDENAIHVTDGAKVSMKNSTITRKSSDSTGGDNSSFYGVGAAVLTTDGTSYISNSTIDTDAAGAAGIFAYGDGVVYASDSSITTAQDTSGGIHVAGGGTLYAWNLTAETNGNSSAAIRSDRGGGTMVVDGGSYTSNGTGSPAIYSTADITVNDAQLTANGSEAICIEGLNSISLYNCDLTGNMGDDSQNDCTWNVILYQSMSGDSEVGNSTFEMNGGTLTAKNGGMFYTTNTESTITLSDVDITNAEDSEFFLRCTGNNNQRGWGQTGSNGADCLFTAIDQEMSGDVIWDSISQLDFLYDRWKYPDRSDTG